MNKLLDSQTLHTALTLLSVEYIKECLGSHSNGTVSAQVTLDKLNKAGLGSTVNAQVLRNLVTTSRKSEISLIKDIKAAYPQALIVPYIDFFRVMKEYNLAVGLIEHYIKPIPEENIEQIYKASEAFEHLSLNAMYYVNKIRIDSDMPKRLTRSIADYIARFPLISDRSILFPNIEDRNRYELSIEVFSNILGRNDWLIAAPVDDVPKNTTIEYYSGREQERIRRIQDPIVFKASRVGAVIVSMWGEEADSSIFDKYR